MSQTRHKGHNGLKGKLSKLLKNNGHSRSRSSTVRSGFSSREGDSNMSVLSANKSSPHIDHSNISFDDSSLTRDHFIDESADDLDLHDVMSDTEESASESEDFEDHSTYFTSTGNDPSMALANLDDEALRTPKYIKITRKSKKSPRILNNLFMAQELRCSQPEYDSESSSDNEHNHPHNTHNGDDFESPMNPNEILAMEFSQNGKYLAVAGRDCKITIWQVITSPLGRLNYQAKEAHETRKSKRSKRKLYSAAPVFLPEPVRVFEGHTKTILCLDWSKNNFLVSGSMDKTAKLWNVERADCLQTFRHTEFVTAVRFHPNDDRFFVSGALDNKARLWSILESSEAYTTHLGDDALITCLTFTPSGTHCLVGGFNGTLFALETQGLNLINQVQLRKRKLLSIHQSTEGQKITGIKIFENPACAGLPDTELTKWNVLITMNDSSVRLIDLNSRKLVTRFKGSSNQKSSIPASMSEDTRYIISGSEDHWCYVWGNNNSKMNSKLRQDLRQYLTDGKKQLAETQKKLGKIMNDNKLWKKLPVHTFLEDKNGQVYIANENSNYAAFHAHHNRVNFAVFAPENTLRLLKFSDDALFDLVKRGEQFSSKETSEDSKKNFDTTGFIIVTSDTSGVIRVFRQDPAYSIRKKLSELKKHSDIGQKTSRRNSSGNMKVDLSSTTSRIIKTKSITPCFDSGKIRISGRPKSYSAKGGSSTMRAPDVSPTSSRYYSSSTVTPMADAYKSTDQDAERPSYFDQTPSYTPSEFMRQRTFSPGRQDVRVGLNRDASKSTSGSERGRVASFISSSTAMASRDSLVQ